jgi:hypothetical protein
MAKLRIAIAAVLMLCVFIPVSAAQARECNNTLAQHTEVLRTLEAHAARARILADQNPLYESDVAYYEAVLREARHCVKMLSPLVSAAR